MEGADFSFAEERTNPRFGIATRAYLWRSRTRPHDVAVRRMRTFLSKTFAGTDGALGMFLSYMSLVAACVRLPEVILIFAGPGGEGETLLLCDLMGTIWGTGHAAAPPSIFQTPEEFRRQGHLYMGYEMGVCRRKQAHSGDRRRCFQDICLWRSALLSEKSRTGNAFR